MELNPARIEHPTLLFVEGVDERGLFGALLRHMGIPNVQLLPIGGKTFLAEARDKANVVEIRMFSDEYFTLVRQNPRIGRYLANGQPMVILFDGKIYRITKAT